MSLLNYCVRSQFDIITFRKMSINRILAVSQASDEIQNLAIKHNATKSPCGYITCAICQYLSHQDKVDHELFEQTTFQVLKPYIEKAMLSITQNRRGEIKKFSKTMTETQRKSYLTDWVATFEIADYLAGISLKSVNPYLYFFRQVGIDHPKAFAKVKFEQAERVKEEEQFKGQKYFYTSFNPYTHHYKEQFKQEVQKNKGSGLPMIIATDVLGHFDTLVIFEGKIYILDSLPYIEERFDYEIHETIRHYHQLCSHTQ